MIQQEPEEDTTNQIEAEVTDKEDIGELKQALAEEKQKAGTYLANWQRAQADFINYKRRSEQEREETSNYLTVTPNDLRRAAQSGRENLDQVGQFASGREAAE